MTVDAHAHASTVWRLFFAAMIVAVMSQPGRAQLSWKTVVNNNVTMPYSGKTFNSYNQPAVNSFGLVVFRARSKGGMAGEPTHGIYTRNMAVADSPILRVFDRTVPVPAPNNTGVPFIEFPSMPRVGLSGSTVVTRGRSQPVWNYLLADGSETRVGTSGVYVQRSGSALTGASQLGVVPDFPHFQVPGASGGTRFDEFPGAPAVNDPYIAFKGNYTEGTLGKTGVYYRDLRTLSTGPAPVRLIANTGTRIPNQPQGKPVKFGSTAPPSAALGYAVFVGLDNEDSPTLGGIYRARLEPNPTLTTLVGLESQVPGEPAGTHYTRLGEGLSFDGRYVAFWAAWGTQTVSKTLYCPTEGNKDRLAYCNSIYPNGFVVQVPVNQGIFVHDSLLRRTYAAAKTGEQFDDFLYWNYSGMVEGGMETDGEPAKWRSSAFAAVSGRLLSFRVAFKGVKAGVDGLYLVRGPLKPTMVTLLDTTTSGQSVDPAAPTDSRVTSLGVERDGFRDGWLVITASMGSAESTEEEGFAGIYATRIP